ncbi:hypothetical protein CKAH01_17956 [Colletotrichum kahawae]|uniref:Uncharacterized protein n=1 Tax=Colletotrichum kahawae TaxID=34407 RepID=A0AAE0D3K9_COLKA|nr:hypothetical protein CKAH01_17956 [Colletotrichum kahawae]
MRQRRRRPAKRQDAIVPDTPATIPTTISSQGDTFTLVESAIITPTTSQLSLASTLACHANRAPQPVPPTAALDHQMVDSNQGGVSQRAFSEEGCLVEIDQLGYDVPVGSKHIWKFPGSSIYVVPAEEVLSPPTMAKWDDFITSFQANFAHVKAEMVAEQCKHKHLRKKSCNLTRFMLEVRVSGRLESMLSKSIQMGPCLWILCGSKWCKTRIREVAQDLTLPVDLSLQRIEVHTGLPLPNALKTIIPISRLPSDTTSGFDHVGGKILYHVEGQGPKSGQLSACGLRCCATYIRNGTVIEQHISRIWGLLTFDNNGLPRENDGDAMTTAHGVFDHLWSLHDSAEEESNESEDKGFSSGSDSCDSELDEASTSSMQSLSIIGDRCASEVKSWVPLVVHAVKYLEKRFPETSLDNEGDSAPADYAILGSHILRPFQNVVESTSSTIITTYARNHELQEGPILLLLGPGNSSEASFLPRSLKLPMNNCQINVRKIRLEAALASGTSGTWLIRESKYCGMVIAAYPGEPLALFMTAEDIPGNIQITFPAVINRVGGPDAPTQLHDKGSKSAKNPEPSSSNSISEIQDKLNASIRAYSQLLKHELALGMGAGATPDESVFEQQGSTSKPILPASSNEKNPGKSMDLDLRKYLGVNSITASGIPSIVG